MERKCLMRASTKSFFMYGRVLVFDMIEVESFSSLSLAPLMHKDEFKISSEKREHKAKFVGGKIEKELRLLQKKSIRRAL